MHAPFAALIDGDGEGRLHLQHGPIDLVIGMDGGARNAIFTQARNRFSKVLEELVCELPLLKRQAKPGDPSPRGVIARRMHNAVMPFAGAGFITPMAAVAGSVAEEVLDAMLQHLSSENMPRRVFVNNGGDIALYLAAGQRFRIGIAREDGAGLGAFEIGAADGLRGIATSGRGGRSLSMGIADSVTVVARTASMADAAATVIANAVDLADHPAVIRLPADAVKDDSDLGERLVVVEVGALGETEIDDALDSGARMAERLRERGLIDRAALFLRQRSRVVGALPSRPVLKSQAETIKHA